MDRKRRDPTGMACGHCEHFQKKKRPPGAGKCTVRVPWWAESDREVFSSTWVKCDCFQKSDPSKNPVK